jgi:purine-binding chemotaxis protein CheW
MSQARTTASRPIEKGLKKAGRPMAEGIGLSATDPQASDEATDVILLVFRIESREHALPVEEVVEVLRMVAATPLPEAPPWVGGVINRRGQVVPLIDVRSRLGAPRREPRPSDAIIVVRIDEVLTGLVVDEVVEVLALRNEAVERAGRVASTALGVSGVARQGKRLILVLDREHLCDGSVDLRPLFDVETSEAAR